MKIDVYTDSKWNEKALLKCLSKKSKGMSQRLPCMCRKQANRRGVTMNIPPGEKLSVPKGPPCRWHLIVRASKIDISISVSVSPSPSFSRPLSLPFSPTLPSSSSSLLTHPRHTANIYIPSANLLIDNVVQLKLLLTLFKSAKYPQFHQRAKSLPQVCWVSMDSEQRVVNKITQLIQALAKRGPLHPSPWEERPCCWDGNAQICCPSSSPCTALGGMWPVFASVTHSSKRCGVSLCYLLYMFLYTSIICLHIFSITYEPMKSDYNQDILI